MVAARLPKPKTCRICKTRYQPEPGLRPRVCSVACAIKLAQHQRKVAAERREREARRELKEAKRGLRTRRDWTKIAQAAFNAFIRERDWDKPCISCGVVNPPERYGGAWDCGHYRSVGAAPELRFEELNAHKQCKACNAGSGRFARKGETVRMQYRERLIERIGREAVHWLEGPHPPKHYTVEELQAIAKKYRAKARELRKARGA